MTFTRRNFIKSGLALPAMAVVPSHLSLGGTDLPYRIIGDRFDPWVEVIPEALRSNARVLHRLSGNRPVLAVIKNNGYGLGALNVARILEDLPEIAGFAAVKSETCINVRDAGIKKPVLHMGMATTADFVEMISKDIQISIYQKDMKKILGEVAQKVKKRVSAHCYLDTGMSRMGIPHDQALSWMSSMSELETLDIIGSFMGFTEDPDYDKVQLNRFQELKRSADKQGVDMGLLHAASSNAIYHFPKSALDMVRPGIGLYGAYPTYPNKEKEIAELDVAYRLCTRVVRTEKLRVGDSVSYGRNYIAQRPTWIATLPIGHADGYLRKAVNGASVLVNGNLYPVIGAVSASHTILEIGDSEEVNIGDLATLVGPDHPDIHPSHLSTVCDVSVYDVLMHMSARLPRVVL